MSIWDPVRRWLAPPDLPDEEQARLARMTHYLLLVVMAGGVMIALGNLAIGDWTTVWIVGLGLLALIGALALNRRGWVQLAGVILLVTLLVAVTAALSFSLGIHDIGALFFPAIVVMAGLLLTRRNYLIVLGLTLAAVAALTWGELWGWFTPAVYEPQELPADFVTTAAVLGITALVARLLADSLRHSLNQARLELRERQQAEAALQHSQAMLQAILDNSTAIIYVKDLEGRYLLANQQYARLARRSVADILGRTDQDLLSPAAAAAFRQNDLAVAAAGRPMEFEETDLRADGEHTTISVKFPLRDAAGKVMAVGGISTDITARKQAQTALQERELLLRAILDNVPADLWVCDAQDRYILQNRISVELVGILIGKTLDDLLLPPDLREAYRDKHLRALRGETVTDEVALEIDGKTHWYYSQQAPIRDGDQILGFLGMNLDITDRRRAEQALQAYSAQLEALRQISLDLAAQLDQPALLQAIVARAAALLRAPVGSLALVRPEADALEWAVAVDPDPSYIGRRQRRGEGLAGRVWETGEPLIVNDYQTWDGRLLVSSGWDAVLGVPVRLGQKLIGVLEVEDRAPRAFTEADARLLGMLAAPAAVAIENARLYAEAQQLIQELEAKNAELERFTYTVSHDLKSPLITIRGYLGYLERDARAGQLERFGADMQRIIAATERMQRLLGELLELSRIGRLMNPPETVPFEAIARDAAWLVEGRLQARGVAVEVATGLPLIHGDRLRLVEAMQNLLDNAAKFMGDQPRPRIEIGQRGRDPAGRPVLFVRDNGQGIAPEYHQKIFGLFDKLDANSEGTGIGLALVKRIIEVHGGRIWVESPGSGGGATFLFTLPPPPKAGA